MRTTAVPAAPDIVKRQPARGGFRKWAAIAGIIAGFLKWIVPGLIAVRSYRRWERGRSQRPTFAWVAGIAGPAIWVLTFGGLFLPVYGVGYGDHEVRMFVDRAPVSTLLVPPTVSTSVGVGLVLVATSRDRTRARFDDALAIAIQPSSDASTG